jgi:RnfABCDGE-type electron transport complex G subunit
VLAIVASVSGIALQFTYSQTKKAIEEQGKSAQVKALRDIFIEGYGEVEDVKGNGIEYKKVWKGNKKTGKPDYYAITGEGVGYNTGSPIVLLVGFANSEKEKSGKRILVGWKAIKSEETPGLGEKIKDKAAPYTLAEKANGAEEKEINDMRTAFQKQFYNPKENKEYISSELKLKKDGGNIEVITGATYTTKGVLAAIKDADARLSDALKKK